MYLHGGRFSSFLITRILCGTGTTICNKGECITYLLWNECKYFFAKLVFQIIGTKSLFGRCQSVFTADRFGCAHSFIHLPLQEVLLVFGAQLHNWLFEGTTYRIRLESRLQFSICNFLLGVRASNVAGTCRVRCLFERIFPCQAQRKKWK